MKSFPKPLTAKEENILLELFYAEDDNQMGSSDRKHVPDSIAITDSIVVPDHIRTVREKKEWARSELIERNLRLVAHIVKKYHNSERELDDLISIGTIGLIKAVDTYKPNKGIRLATYASRCIDNELLMMLRSSKKQAKDVYLYEPIGADKEGNEISLLDICMAPEVDVVEQMTLRDNISKLHDYMNQVLSDREREIIVLRYGLNGRAELTQRELAEKFHISRSYVSRLEKKALKKLQECYKEKRNDEPVSV